MRKTVICLNILFALLVVGVFTAPEVFAAGGDPGFTNPLGDDIQDVRTFFKTLLEKIIVPIGAVVVAFFIIWSGFLFVTAGGSDDKIKTARATFTWTMIGAAILLGAWTITLAIEATICQIAPETPGCSST